MIYQVSSSKVRIDRWYESREEAIKAFERQCKKLGIAPPLSYPPGLAEMQSRTIARLTHVALEPQAHATAMATCSLKRETRSNNSAPHDAVNINRH